MPRERVIGLVLTHAYAYYRRILRGIGRFAESRPHWRFVSVEPEIGRPVRELLKNVDAAIAAVHNREWVNFVQRSGAIVVNIDPVETAAAIPRVTVDNRLIGDAAAQHFLERGIRSFAFVGHPWFAYSREREEGFRQAIGRSGNAVAVYHSRIRRNYDASGCRDSVDRGAARWLASLPRPTGVFTASDRWGVEVIDACRSVRLRVPDDIAVLGVDDDDLYCEMARPSMSSVILPSETVGMRAAELVDGLLRRRSGLDRDVQLPPVGVAVRRSTDVLSITDPDVVSAIRYIRDNSHHRLRVADVLDEVQVSRRSLERHFQAALGTSLGAEIRRARLEHAKNLLVQTDLSVADVAAHAGFSNFRHLADIFRQQLRQTPTRFRAGFRSTAKP